MKRILVAVACLLPFALAAEAGINRHSPEAAVDAAYVADDAALHGRGDGIMGDNTLRARFFSRSLLRSIAAEEVIGGNTSPAIARDPFSDQVLLDHLDQVGALDILRGPDFGNSRRRQGARRVRSRRRRARALDLHDAVRTGRMAH